MPTLGKGQKPKTHVRGWEIDDTGVQFARLYLRLKHPVEVRVTNLRKTSGRYNGLHDRGTRGKRAHAISVSTYLSSEEAGRTIWHEMAHAAAREQMGKAAFRKWHEPEREHAAEAHERLQDRWPTVKAR